MSAPAPKVALLETAVEAMRRGDFDAVRRIYAEGVATGHATFETEAPDWESWDATHRIEARLVARAEGAVVGFAALSPVSGRSVYAGVAEVSVYLRIDFDRLLALADRIPSGAVPVAESGVSTEGHARAVAAAGYRMALVGTALMTASDPGALARSLLAAGREDAWPSS